MVTSQSEIIEKLSSLNIDTPTKLFIKQIMDFYKGHMQKLKNIIVQKQEQIEGFFELKNNYEDKITEISLALQRQKQDEHQKINQNQSSMDEVERLQSIISNLRADFESKDFDIKVLNDDKENQLKKIDILESQNKMYNDQIMELKMEAEGLRNRIADLESKEPKPDFHTTQILEEINNVKKLMKTKEMGDNSYSYNPPREPRTERNRTRDYQEKRYSPQNMQTNTIMDSKPFNNTSFNDHVPQQDTPINSVPIESEPTANIDINELQEYLSFLVGKEKDLQNLIWNLPERVKNVQERKKKMEMNKELEELTKEIASIRITIKESQRRS